MNCNCKKNDCGCNDVCNSCPIKLDFSCIIYNKDSSEVSTLDGFNLPNGTSLKGLIEVLDEKIKDLDVSKYNLLFIRQNYIVNSFKQLNESIDTILNDLFGQINNINTNISTQLTVVNSSSLTFSTSGILNHTLTGSIKISQSDELLSILNDGLFVEPQLLSVDYSTKKLTISHGNTVDLSGIVCSPSGYLGNLSSDPTTAINGNYWFNTTQNKLKIKINNLIKEIITN